MASAGMELRLYKLCRNGDHQMMFTLAQPLAGSCLTIPQRRKDLPEIPNARFLAAPLETREGLLSPVEVGLPICPSFTRNQLLRLIERLGLLRTLRKKNLSGRR